MTAHLLAAGSGTNLDADFSVALFWIPNPLPIGAAKGMMVAAPASKSRFAKTTSSEV